MEEALFAVKHTMRKLGQLKEIGKLQLILQMDRKNGRSWRITVKTNIFLEYRQDMHLIVVKGVIKNAVSSVRKDWNEGIRSGFWGSAYSKDR